MKKNLLLMISLILICCGCTAEYKLKINKDLTVEESIYAIEDAQFFNEYTNSSAQRVIGFILEPHLDYLNANNYKVQESIGVSEAGVLITNTFGSIAKYKEKSDFTKQFAADWEYIENGDEITLKIKGEFNTAEQDQSGRYPVKTAKISIQLPFKVLEHNADSVDKDTYTWFIEKPGQEKEIRITFDKTVTGGINALYFVIGGIIVVIAIVAIWASGKIVASKGRNDFPE